MKTTPKTLHVFLPEGTAAGIQIAELTTRIVQVREERSILLDFVNEISSGIQKVGLLLSDDSSIILACKSTT